MTKIKSTTTAPTYTIKKRIGRYSSSKKNNKQDTLKNDKIRKRAECKGLFAKTSKTDEKIQRVEKKEKIATFDIIINIIKFFYLKTMKQSFILLKVAGFEPAMDSIKNYCFNQVKLYPKRRF